MFPRIDGEDEIGMKKTTSGFYKVQNYQNNKISYRKKKKRGIHYNYLCLLKQTTQNY
jgi:hypothetical protein